MHNARAPHYLLAWLYLGFLAFLVVSFNELPEHVASHFNAAGEPDGWMSRAAHMKFMAVFGTVFPFGIVTVCYLVRFLPDALINIPHRDHWLAPERRSASLQQLFRHSLWFACLGTGFMAGVHLLVLRANTQQPPRLSVALMLIVTGYFIIGLLWWIVSLLRRFRLPSKA